MEKKVINYKKKTIILALIITVAIIGFVFFPENIEGNIVILLIAITSSIYELKKIHKFAPKFYLLTRYIVVLLFTIALILTLFNR